MQLDSFINEAYHNYGPSKTHPYSWRNIGDFMCDKEKCLRLIYHYLDVNNIYQQQDLNWYNSYRSQHILFTFLLGLGISNRYNLLQGVNTINMMPDEYLWMLTSIVHDYGYLKQGLGELPELCDIDGKYYLLSDDSKAWQLDETNRYSQNYPKYLTYTYDTISNYYNYRRIQLNKHPDNKDNETVDHGIFGACKCYEEYCDFFIENLYRQYCVSSNDKENDVRICEYNSVRINPNQHIVRLARTEPVLYKTACLIAAQHNMFRSNGPASDYEYSKYGLSALLSSSPIAVTIDNPLLYLLSIVDTIECTKRFSRNSSCNGLFLHPSRLSVKTILQNIDIELDDDGIIVDYSKLESKIRKNNKFFLLKNDWNREMLKLLEHHVSNVAGMQTWIKCKTEQVNSYCVKIQIQRL